MASEERDIIGFTPAPGRLWAAHFKNGDDGEEWEWPVAGWALVRHDYGSGESGGVENRIDPVVVIDGKYPSTITDYCENMGESPASDTLYRELRCQVAPLHVSTEGPGSRDELIKYVQTVIEQRTTPNDDTSAERLARGIVTSILSRLGAGYSIAAGSQVEQE